MITSIQKLQRIAQDLTDRLSVRFKNGSGLNTVTQGFDSNGNPYLQLSNATDGLAAGNPVVVIVLEQDDAVSKDIFGNNLLAYTPSLALVGWEADANGKNTPAMADLMNIFWELIPFEIELQGIQVAHGTAVTPTSVEAATPFVDLDQLYWPTKGA